MTTTCSPGLVRVIHGPNDDVFQGLVGVSVGSIQLSLIDAFNIPDEAAAFVNGKRTRHEHRLNPGDILEFILQWGRKGATADRDDYFVRSGDPHLKLNEVLFRLNRLEELLKQVLKEQSPPKDFYSVEEFGKLVDLAAYTVREHCRLGRLQAEKTECGRGTTQEWRIPHSELVRYRNFGLLPLRKHSS